MDVRQVSQVAFLHIVDDRCTQRVPVDVAMGERCAGLISG